MLLSSVDADGEPWSTDGTFEGRIATAPRGNGGFGYDPIFEPLTEPAGGRTVGEMSADEKNAVSHRAIAARQMGTLLRDGSPKQPGVRRMSSVTPARRGPRPGSRPGG